MQSLVSALPVVNATMNATCVMFLVLGLRAIRRGEKARHLRLMLSALTCSFLFLVGYITRMMLTGTHRFPGEGPLKVVYLVLLFSHMVLAMALVPMVLRALFLAWKERFTEHRALARFTWPTWMYVSVTGVVVYWMLYHVAPSL